MHASGVSKRACASIEQQCASRQVNPAWQRSGIGRGAVERLTSMLLAEDIATINLYAEPGVTSLYERLGFQKVGLIAA